MVENNPQFNPYRKINSTSAYRRLMMAYYFMAKHPSWFRKKVEKGYSRDLCSYALSDIGSSLTDKGPLGKLPKPDFLVCGNNICGTVIKWYEVQARALEVPIFFLDTPFVHDEIQDHTLRYVQNQMKDYAHFLERQLKRPFSEEKFKKVASCSFEAIKLWREILELSKNRPAPMAAFDAFIHMAPIVTLRGTRWAVWYYRKLKREIEERVKKRAGAFAREEIRLIWDNIPIWYDIRNLSRILSSQGAVLVADTYTSAWALEHLDLTNQLDGRREVSKATGKPGLIIEADHTDSRSYAPKQVEKQIQTFLDIVRGN